MQSVEEQQLPSPPVFWLTMCMYINYYSFQCLFNAKSNCNGALCGDQL